MRISLESVTKLFQKTMAVDAISLSIEQGECFFLLGPSGCGKTTILRMIAGFIEPDLGSILFDGRVVNGLPPHKRNTGMVFQQYALWPHMTVFDNVAFGLRAPGRRLNLRAIREKASHALAIVKMDDFADRKPNQLSGGQQQRVALARALVIEPGCLLFDEPLSNLDSKLRIEMRMEIRRIVKDAGITTVYVTHDQAEALSMADRCAILKNGRLEQLGAPREIYERPASKFTADFVGGSNLISGVIKSTSGSETSVEAASGLWISTAQNPGLKTGSSVVLSIRPGKLRVSEFANSSRNLIRGRRLETMYYGDIVEHLIALPGSQTLRVIEEGTTGLKHSRQEEILCSADPQDILLLPNN